MTRPRTYLALDVGEKRIGVAVGDDTVRIAMPLETVEVNGHELEEIARLVAWQNATVIVVGYPRNQSGEPTAQTDIVEQFASGLQDMVDRIDFQDESLTSVMAEQRLRDAKKPFTKGDIDAHAAAIILQDYLERHAS